MQKLLKEQAGFTLLEIFIVVVVIIIFAAILFLI